MSRPNPVDDRFPVLSSIHFTGFAVRIEHRIAQT